MPCNMNTCDKTNDNRCCFECASFDSCDNRCIDYGEKNFTNDNYKINCAYYARYSVKEIEEARRKLNEMHPAAFDSHIKKHIEDKNEYAGTEVEFGVEFNKNNMRTYEEKCFELMDRISDVIKELGYVSIVSTSRPISKSELEW